MERRIFAVSEVNQLIKAVLDDVPLLGSICVRGELSNYKMYPSGHHYFTLKDEQSALRCVMFRGQAARLRFRPENGMKVLALGRVTVFPRDGAYQLYCNELSPDGVGDLHVAFEQLKEKLWKEGLFAEDHKKPLPLYPQAIAVITSSAGAAVHDMIRILRRRYPLAKVKLLPVRVQGAEAPPEIAGALRYANRYQVADLIITGRGGGSMEDLWAFNDERVARAIYDSEIPVISAVGHEPDVTIADFVADARAATPSHAAEGAGPGGAAGETAKCPAAPDPRPGQEAGAAAPQAGDPGGQTGADGPRGGDSGQADAAGTPAEEPGLRRRGPAGTAAAAAGGPGRLPGRPEPPEGPGPGLRPGDGRRGPHPPAGR